MGSWYEFCCTNCGFEARTSGRRDMGMSAITQTIVCYDCRMLYDVMTGSWDFPLSPEETQRRLVCRKDAKHRVSVWNHPGPCPVCDTLLERGRQTAIWD